MKLIKDLGMQYPTKNSKQRHKYGLYECPDCGNHTRVMTHSVKKGLSQRCKECGMKITCASLAKHGDCTNGIRRLYNIWAKIKNRCNNKNDARYKDYGGRGIKICTSWMSYETFREWALSNGYKGHLTIDRIDNDGNYEPSNCRWSTYKKQNNNRRDSILNRFSLDKLSDACEFYYNSNISIVKLSTLMSVSIPTMRKILKGGY